ncbi:hypothetical protein JCM11641_001713 [Rhodosporidiobolus odoratus]
MGCSQSAQAAVDQDAKLSHKIDEELKRSKKEQLNVTKALLLGPGESGKSTICKQMRLCVQSAQVILAALPSLSLTFPSTLENTADVLLFAEVDNLADRGSDGEMKDEISEALQLFWATEGAKKAVEQSAHFSPNDSAGYFLDAVRRTSAQHYLPTTQDILYARVQSTGAANIESSQVVLSAVMVSILTSRLGNSGML